MNKKHVVIFSHGFGTKKDDRGLLSGELGIAESLDNLNIKTVLFDYNEISEANSTLTLKSLSQQAEILREIINKTVSEYPDSMIDIIAHSQGCIIPALLKPKNIRKIIFLAPSLDTDIARTIEMFASREGTEIDIKGTSKLARKDGTLTIVPAEFWEERSKINTSLIYNELSKLTQLTMVIAKQDDILKKNNVSGLNKNIKIIYLDGDHGFHSESDRKRLILEIKDILI